MTQVTYFFGFYFALAQICFNSQILAQDPDQKIEIDKQLKEVNKANSALDECLSNFHIPFNGACKVGELDTTNKTEREMVGIEENKFTVADLVKVKLVNRIKIARLQCRSLKGPVPPIRCNSFLGICQCVECVEDSPQDGSVTCQDEFSKLEELVAKVIKAMKGAGIKEMTMKPTTTENTGNDMTKSNERTSTPSKANSKRFNLEYLVVFWGIWVLQSTLKL